MKKLTFYSARTLSILLIIFFALFILEGFSPGFGWRDSLMHLILVLLVTIITITAFKWPRIGSWFFILLGLLVLLNFRRGLSSAIIGGIPFLIGILFLIESFWKDKKTLLQQ